MAYFDSSVTAGGTGNANTSVSNNPSTSGFEWAFLVSTTGVDGGLNPHNLSAPNEAGWSVFDSPAFDAPNTRTEYQKVVNSTTLITATQNIDTPAGISWTSSLSFFGLASGSLPTVVQKKSVTGAWSTDQTFTFNSNLTAGNVILVTHTTSRVIAAGTGLTVTDTLGQTYPSIVSVGVGNTRQDIWFVAPTLGGADSVTLHVNGGFFSSAIFIAYELSGLALLPQGRSFCNPIIGI